MDENDRGVRSDLQFYDINNQIYGDISNYRK